MEALGTFNFSVAPRHHYVLFFWGISHHAAIGGKGALWPLSWEQSNAVWILIKFIKQITQQLGEAGVHLPAPQTDLCRDVDWMVVKTKLPSSADGLLSPVGEIWWRSNNSFPPPGFCSLQLWLKKPFSVFSQPKPPSHPPLPSLFMWAMFKSEWFVPEASPGWSHFVYVPQSSCRK